MKILIVVFILILTACSSSPPKGVDDLPQYVCPDGYELTMVEGSPVCEFRRLVVPL